MNQQTVFIIHEFDGPTTRYSYFKKYIEIFFNIQTFIQGKVPNDSKLRLVTQYNLNPPYIPEGESTFKKVFDVTPVYDYIQSCICKGRSIVIQSSPIENLTKSFNLLKKDESLQSINDEFTKVATLFLNEAINTISQGVLLISPFSKFNLFPLIGFSGSVSARSTTFLKWFSALAEESFIVFEYDKNEIEKKPWMAAIAVSSIASYIAGSLMYIFDTVSEKRLFGERIMNGEIMEFLETVGFGDCEDSGRYAMSILTNFSRVDENEIHTPWLLAMHKVIQNYIIGTCVASVLQAQLTTDSLFEDLKKFENPAMNSGYHMFCMLIEKTHFRRMLQRYKDNETSVLHHFVQSEKKEQFMKTAMNQTEQTISYLPTEESDLPPVLIVEGTGIQESYPTDIELAVSTPYNDWANKRDFSRADACQRVKAMKQSILKTGNLFDIVGAFKYVTPCHVKQSGRSQIHTGYHFDINPSFLRCIYFFETRYFLDSEQKSDTSYRFHLLSSTMMELNAIPANELYTDPIAIPMAWMKKSDFDIVMKSVSIFNLPIEPAETTMSLLSETEIGKDVKYDPRNIEKRSIVLFLSGKAKSDYVEKIKSSFVQVTADVATTPGLDSKKYTAIYHEPNKFMNGECSTHCFELRIQE